MASTRGAVTRRGLFGFLGLGSLLWPASLRAHVRSVEAVAPRAGEVVLVRIPVNPDGTSADPSTPMGRLHRDLRAVFGPNRTILIVPGDCDVEVTAEGGDARAIRQWAQERIARVQQQAEAALSSLRG